KNIEVLAIFGLIKLAVTIADRAPVVSGCGIGFAERRGDHIERIVFDDLPDHLLESIDFKIGKIGVDSGDFISQRGGKIFFVADHHIYVWRNAAVYFLCLLLPAESFPKRGAIVEVVGNDSSVFSGSLHSLESNIRRGR